MTNISFDCLFVTSLIIFCQYYNSTTFNIKHICIGMYACKYFSHKPSY